MKTNSISSFLVLILAVVCFAGIAEATGPSEPPDLPDLNVLYISRTPRYPACVLKYQKLPGSGDEAMPCVADPATREAVTPEQAAKIKRWPDEGEEVTFRALVANHGSQPTGEFDYTWYIDGCPVTRNLKHESLDGPSLMTDEYEEIVLSGTTFKESKRVEGTYAFLELKWKWKNGRHYVRLDLDGGDKIDEICEINNSVVDATDACTFVMAVDAYTYNTLAQGENHWKSYNFDDILKYHRDQMHRKFKMSVHPATPHGILEEIRIDWIFVQPEGEKRDPIHGVKLQNGWDSAWDFTGYCRRENEDNPAQHYGYLKSQDWGLPHELAHQMGLVDLYCLDTEGGDGGNKVRDKNGDPILLSHFVGINGMMRGHGDRLFSEHSAVALNQQLGRRRGYFGDYLWSVPEKNAVRILDVEGRPVRGAKLTFYQHKGRYVDDEVVFSGETDRKGEFLMPNRKCFEFTTDRGYTIKPNPFGQINVVGTNGVFFIVVEAKNYTEYVWLPITRLNVASWSDDPVAVYDIPTVIPGRNSTPPVENFRQVTLDGGAVELRWDRRNEGETYTLYQRTNFPPRWVLVKHGREPDVTEELTEPVYRVPGTGGRFAVVANFDGKTSAFTHEERVTLLRDPTGITLDSDGRRILRDRGHGQPIMFRADNSTLGVFGTFHLGNRGGADVARFKDGRLVLLDHRNQPIFLFDHRGHWIRGRNKIGSQGDGPMQFNNPLGVTIDSNERVWIADTGNGRIQVLDSELKGMIAEAGADVGLKAPTKVAELPGGKLFAVADPEAGIVAILKFDGKSFTAGTPLEVARPVYVTASEKHLYVSDEGADPKAPGRVLSFRIVGESLQPADSYSKDLGKPYGLAYDAERKLLVVVDRTNKRLLNVPVK